jgi:N-acetylmuramoyl-L-alanine amidase
MVYQEHAFEAVQHGYFYQRAREKEKGWRGGVLRENGIALQNSAYAAWRLPPLHGIISLRSHATSCIFLSA